VSPEELAQALEGRFDEVTVALGEVTCVVARENLVARLTELRDEDALGFNFLSDLSGVDWPEREKRFWIAYHLLSLEHGHRVRLKVGVAEDDAVIPTATGVFPGAEFMEREVFDMLGVDFEGHPDMRRILMPEDWEGHPHRKDYDLGGVKTQYKGAYIPPVSERLH
jgi:NADH-quinone oxidoreductase subunit C